MAILRILFAMVIAVATCAGSQAQTPQHRIALVIGQGSYNTGALPTAVNDAGIVAQALNDSGFELVEGRDLDLAGLRQLVEDFLGRLEKSGPDTVVAIYMSGYAAQLEGDNYLLPVNARIGRESDIALAGFRLSDLIRSINAATTGAKIVIIDAPRGYPSLRGKAIAAGLAIIEPPKDMLIAYATAPGNFLPDDRKVGSGDDSNQYGFYARAIVEQLYQQPGIEADELFKRVRLQIHEVTAGIQIPWHGYGLTKPFFFFPGGEAGVPAARPERAMTAEDAYAIAIETDTIKGYQEFLKLYPDHPLARRIKVLLANRREAVFWNRTVNRGTPEAYWTYLKTYPKGPHVADARNRLEMLSRSVYPPADFPMVVYVEIPPPIEIETVYETTYIYNDYRDYYDYPPPPPPPVYLLPPVKRIPWGRPVWSERPGFLPIPPRPEMLPPPVKLDRHPPRIAPVMPLIDGSPAGRPAARRPDIGREPSMTLPRPPGSMVPPIGRTQSGRPERIERPVPPTVQQDRQPSVERPQSVQPDRAKQMERSAPPTVRQQRSRPVERPQPMQPERGKQMERSAPPAIQQERQRPVERSQPTRPERLRQIERPTSPAVQQERSRPMERQQMQPERPRSIERPQPMQQPERARQIERSAPPAFQQERSRPMERPQPVEQERPRQFERASPPSSSSPAPAMSRPEPQQSSPSPSSSPSPRERPRRPGEPPQ